jgi:hypothetical protein
MIKYSLTCDEKHVFTSWFRSSADYEEQARRGLVECPTCQSTRVGKAIMAPSVARRDRDQPAHSSPQQEPEDGGQPMALLDEGASKIRTALRELRDKIIESSTDVGDQFADQARRMHEGEIPTRAIRGRTSPDEARSLWDNGVPIMPIPMLPDDQN